MHFILSTYRATVFVVMLIQCRLWCYLSKELAVTLQHDIPAMLSALPNMGLNLDINLEDLTRKEGVLS